MAVINDKGLLSVPKIKCYRMEENRNEGPENDEDDDPLVDRSSFLVIFGWITLFILYWSQVGLLVSILAVPQDFLFFVPAFVFTCVFLYWSRSASCVANDKTIWYVWTIWGTYIVAYIVVVSVIFSTITKDLTEKDILGIDALKITLSITPALLILFFQLSICPSYQKPVLYLSIIAALNIVDGIQMLEIFLLQNEERFDFDWKVEDLRNSLMENGGITCLNNETEKLKDFLLRNERHFDLDSATEVSIIVFACTCFLLSSFGLVRNKFKANGNVEGRAEIWAFFGLMETIGINFPFLVLRIIIWKTHQYSTFLFIAKNAISLVIGAVAFGLLRGIFKCEKKRNRPENDVRGQENSA